MYGEPPGLVVNAEDSRSERRGFKSQLHQKNLDGNDGPLDGRKTNENNKDSQMGQVTPKKYLKKKYINCIVKNFTIKTKKNSSRISNVEKCRIYRVCH